MDRRGFLRGALGTLSATVGAFALRSGVDARESASAGVPGQQVDALMSLATQGEAHYVTPLPGITGTLVAGSFPDYDPAFPLKSLVVRPTGDGRDVWEIITVRDPDANMEAYCESFVNETIDGLFPAHVALRTPLLKPDCILGEIRPITDAPAFLSEPL